LPGRDGRYIRSFPWDGVDLHTCLFEAAAGRELESTTADLYPFGRALASLHSAKIAPDAKLKERRIDAADLCHSTCALLPKHGAAATALAIDIQAVAPFLAKVLASSSLREGFCHGDSYLQNARLLGEIVTFFDFEECGFGPQALDLALMVPWLESEPDGDRLWAALEAGYTEHTPLTRDELLTFPALILLSELRRVQGLARFHTMPETLWEGMRLRLTTRIEAFLVGKIGSSMDRI
jgi:Ser/Thr protein kinase RdoA (MazF antagonist)